MPENNNKSKFTIKKEKWSAIGNKIWSFGFHFTRTGNELYLWITLYIWGITIGWIDEIEMMDEEEE